MIVSDHGFLAINKELNVMVALRDAGLITTDANGKVTSWKVYPRNLTGSFFLETNDKNDKESAAKAIAVMQKLAKRSGEWDCEDGYGGRPEDHGCGS